MLIQNIKSENIEACCTFNYKSYTISASTICKPSSIAVFKKKGQYDSFKFEASTIEKAIEKINNLKKDN